MQEIGDIDRLIGPGSCLLRERALAALRVSPQLGTLLAELAAASPFGRHLFRDQFRDRLEQNRPGRQRYVVLGLATRKGTMDGKDISTAVRYTRVYVNRDGRWQVVQFEQTRVAP